MTDSLALMADLIARARAAGADAADAVLVAGTSLSVQRRLGQTEQLERAEGPRLFAIDEVRMKLREFLAHGTGLRDRNVVVLVTVEHVDPLLRIIRQ
jgi:hypothetical protein